MMLDNEISEVATTVGERIKKLIGTHGAASTRCCHLPLQGGKRMRPFMW